MSAQPSSNMLRSERSSPGLTARRVPRSGIPKKLADWKNNSSQGRLIRKQAGRVAGMLCGNGSFTCTRPILAPAV